MSWLVSTFRRPVFFYPKLIFLQLDTLIIPPTGCNELTVNIVLTSLGFCWCHD